MKYLVLFFLILAGGSAARCQGGDTLAYPEVGRPMPDLTVRNIAYYPKATATVADFRGKWLLLDFWSLNCGACILALPKSNEIQKELGEKVQVMMVGIQDPDNKIQPMYAKYRERQHLTMPCAFDSLLANRLDIFIVPHIIAIDEKGIVRAVVESMNVTDMKEILAGRNPGLKASYRRMSEYNNSRDQRVPFDAGKPFLVNNNGSTAPSVLYQSVMTPWDMTTQEAFFPKSFDDGAANGMFQVLGASLDMLYNYAYFGLPRWGYKDTLRYGKYCDLPILEIKDSSSFIYSYKYGRNLFTYSLVRPTVGNTPGSLQKNMQRDLSSFLGFESTVEIRKCPYWKIVATPGAVKKLETKGGKLATFELSPKYGFGMKNCSFSVLVDRIRGANSIQNRLKNETAIILDETGITGNVDLTMDCVMSDLEDVRKALRVNGLDLVKSEKDMRVVVIRDRASQ